MYGHMQAIDRLLESGAKTVVITSVEVEDIPGKLVLLAKNRNGRPTTRLGYLQ